MSSAARLVKNMPLDGITTNQLVESTANMLLPFRMVGPTRCLLGINGHQAEEYAKRRNTTQERMKSGHLITKRAWDIAVVNNERSSNYVVVRLYTNKRITTLWFNVFLRLTKWDCAQLEGVVAKKGEDSCTCSITRDPNTGVMSFHCPCLYPQEFGIPCPRLIALMKTGQKKCAEQGYGRHHWDNFMLSAFAIRHHQKTMVAQYSNAFVCLPIPDMLTSAGSAKDKLSQYMLRKLRHECIENDST